MKVSYESEKRSVITSWKALLEIPQSNLIILGCDLQQAKSRETPSPLVWTQAHTTLHHGVSYRRVLWVLLLGFLVASFFSPLGFLFFNSILRLSSANQSTLQNYHCHRYVSTETEADFLICSSAKDNIVWDYVLKQHVAVIPGWQEAY